MELFTLGEGRYGEQDVKEAARAFTGWSLDRDTGEFTFRPLWHDYGDKTVLGKSGAFDGDQVIDILLARPETAEFITRKLWREFVSREPNPREVARWAAIFRDSRYEVKPLLRAILTSQAFWSPQNRGALIKSPMDLVVGTMRTFDIHPVDLRPAVFAVASLGQNPFSPPNVKGWPGGDAWINSSTLLGRKQWLDRVFRGSDPTMMASASAAPSSDEAAEAKPKGRSERYRRLMERGMADYTFDGERFIRRLPVSADGAARVDKLVLATAPVNPAPEDADAAERVRVLVADPAYELK
jgi:uncharacterized protein (DUF1800 family)